MGPAFTFSHQKADLLVQNALWPKKVPSQASTRKRSLTFYIWDHKEVMLEHYLEQIETVKQ
jgi:hypothetical protein